MVRTGLRAALHSFGFRSTTDTSSFVKLHDMLEQDAIDLLVTSSELEGNDVNWLIQELRNQRLGTNPFVVVIVLLASAEPDYVKRVIDSGADDLILTPVVPDQLMIRIEKLARTRKPFVITHDYTGPDRRTKARAFESHSAPMLDVPNPLKERVQGGLDGTRMAVAIRETGLTLNRLKIERYAVQIDWLVSHISATIRDGMAESDQSLVVYTSRLVHVSEDMIRRMKGSPAEGYIPPVAELLDIARRVDAAISAVSFTDLEKLLAASKVISRSLGNPPVAVGARRVG